MHKSNIVEILLFLLLKNTTLSRKMGIPAFFMWLTNRYPQIVVDALSESDLEQYQSEYQNDKNKDPNEIGLDDADDKMLIREKVKNNNPRIDNLYLDMNGIIHPCCHPTDRPAPRSQIEMFNLIFEYTDKVLEIVKP